MTVRLDIRDRIAHITLARSAKRNALDEQVLVELRKHIAEVRENGNVSAVVLRGEGGHFSAGADLTDWANPSQQRAAQLSQLGQDAFTDLSRLPTTTVAVLEGAVMGGGFELALACDIRVATDDARLALPELGLGNLPSWGGIPRLVDIAGLGLTRELLLTGRPLTGTRAAQLGLVSEAAAAAELDGVLEQLLHQVSNSEPLAVALAKQLLAGMEQHQSLESSLAAYTAGLESAQARKQAFLDRRAARASDRHATSVKGASR